MVQPVVLEEHEQLERDIQTEELKYAEDVNQEEDIAIQLAAQEEKDSREKILEEDPVDKFLKNFILVQKLHPRSRIGGDRENLLMAEAITAGLKIQLIVLKDRLQAILRPPTTQEQQEEHSDNT